MIQRYKIKNLPINQFIISKIIFDNYIFSGLINAHGEDEDGGSKVGRKKGGFGGFGGFGGKFNFDEIEKKLEKCKEENKGDEEKLKKIEGAITRCKGIKEKMGQFKKGTKEKREAEHGKKFGGKGEMMKQFKEINDLCKIMDFSQFKKN